MALPNPLTALDEEIAVVDHEAFSTARRLAIEEGVLVGMSNGAAVAGALRIANRMGRGVIVGLLPDRGERYPSTELFQPAAQAAPKVA